MNKKTHETSTSKILKNFEKKLKKAIVNDRYLNHVIKVRRHGYELEFKPTCIDCSTNAVALYEGMIVSSSENSPYKVGDSFNMSANEIKYHTVLR